MNEQDQLKGTSRTVKSKEDKATDTDCIHPVESKPTKQKNVRYRKVVILM